MGLSSQEPSIPLVPCVMFNRNKQIGKETGPTLGPNVVKLFIAVIYDFS